MQSVLDDGAVGVQLGHDSVGDQNGDAAADRLEQTSSGGTADVGVRLQGQEDEGIKGAGNILQRLGNVLGDLVEQAEVGVEDM